MSYLDTARNTLLEPVGVSEIELDRLLGHLGGKSIDHADAYFQYQRSESWRLEEGIVKSGSFGLDQGVGLRAVSDDKTGFAFSDDLTIPALTSAAKSARGIAHGIGISNLPEPLNQSSNHPSLYHCEDPLRNVSEKDKIALMHKVEQAARDYDSRIKQVIVDLMGTYEIILVARLDGKVAADLRPLIRLNVTVIAEQNGRRESGSYGGGGRTRFDYFIESDRALAYAKEAARQAIVNLDAVESPAGSMTVVLGPGWPGILLHEAVGHGLEGDFNRKGLSAYSDRVGEKVASELCTIVDDGTIVNRRGSLSLDDEGTQTQCTVLIEQGILKGYMQDLTNARLMKQEPTGNGRRESYAHLPMTRMTNTYMLPGESTHEEIVESVEDGIYAVTFAGGSVDITSGNFSFSASEAYRIQKGKITYPLKGATLIGNGPDTMTKVSMVGNDLQMDSGIGTCGKEGQSVPVGVGQPTMRIDGITVGGAQV